MYAHPINAINAINSGAVKPTKFGGVGSLLEHQSLRMVCPNCDSRRSGPCRHHANQAKITSS